MHVCSALYPIDGSIDLLFFLYLGELLADVVNICQSHYENQMYLFPHEKYMLVKVIGFALFLMDDKPITVDNRGDKIEDKDAASKCNIYKLDVKKHHVGINIPKLDRIFHELEVVPLYGDMQISPFSQYVTKTPNYKGNESKWPLANETSKNDECHFTVDVVKMMREQHNSFVVELAKYTNKSSVQSSAGSTQQQPNVAVEQQQLNEQKAFDTDNRQVANIALQGLHLMSQWTSHVVKLYSWKLMHPTDPHQNNACPQEAEDYERAIRYNYSNVEKSAFVEVISMIKSLQLLMGTMETAFNEAIKRHIYAELQTFVQSTLREPLRKSVKNKKDLIRTIITAVRETCADWLKGSEPYEDPASKGLRDRKADAPFDLRVPRRFVGPGSTQLYLVRTMLESLISAKSGVGSKRTLRKDIEGPYVLAIDEFHRQSFFWSYLLQFSDSLMECTSDLSQLWFREFYLEMTRGERIQFPIEMSFPWILTDHVLQTREARLMECVLYTLDIYNDAALFALTRFKKQYLYDEVEAELNLCFDQFVFKLSDQILAYYKHLAGSTILDQRFREECIRHGYHVEWPRANRYATLMRQRHVQLLGRWIDLNHLLTQRITNLFIKSVDMSISRFESSPLASIMELEGQIDLHRLVHRMLSEHLRLDSFDDILQEVNRSVVAPYGRIALHVFWELNYDFILDYCYNASTNRFVKAQGISFAPPVVRIKCPVPTSYVWGSKALNTAFQSIYS